MARKRCTNSVCSFCRDGRCNILPNSKYFKCKQCGDDDIIDI